MEILSPFHVYIFIMALRYARSAPADMQKVNVQQRGHDHAQVIANKSDTSEGGISLRFPDFEDERLNWGVMVDEGAEENEEAYNRPITIIRNVPKPIRTKNISKGSALMVGERTPQFINKSKAIIPVRHDAVRNNSNPIKFLKLNSHGERTTSELSSVNCEAAVIACCSLKYDLRQQCKIAKECALQPNICDLPSVQKSINNMIHFYDTS